jgi:SAM-dependent methyltransferase
MTARGEESLAAGFFDEIYASADDPWSFATSPYEAEKYATTLAALPRARYEAAFEIGCSIGVLTTQLAPRCDALLAVDVSATALAQARQRCLTLPWVRVEQRSIPAAFPDEQFDLVLVSEVGYYWSWADLDLAIQRCAEHLRPAGHLLLVHWTPVVAEYPLTGDEVHERVAELAASGQVPLRWHGGLRRPSYRLDLFNRLPSPAA